MKTEGLEGLAALASASASSPSQGETTSTTNPPGQTATTSEMSVAAPASTSRSVSSSAPTASASAGMDGNYGLLTASNIMQALQAGQTQQWHQTVASTNNAMNPSALSNSNIALLMGMQQQQQQQQIPQAPPQPNASTLNTMQQINYYQQLMNGQAGQQMTNGAGGGASSGSDFVNPNQAMALSLALQSQQRTQATGTSFCLPRLSSLLLPNGPKSHHCRSHANETARRPVEVASRGATWTLFTYMARERRVISCVLIGSF